MPHPDHALVTRRDLVVTRRRYERLIAVVVAARAYLGTDGSAEIELLDVLREAVEELDE